MENNKQNQTEVKNFYGGIYFDRCQLTDVTFQTLVQGDMRMRPDEEKEGEKGEEAEAVKEEAVNTSLNNFIFSPSLFATAERLGRLYDLIASALEELQGKNELFLVICCIGRCRSNEFSDKRRIIRQPDAGMVSGFALAGL